MTDKNGIEIKTGAIVEITGAYFKNDNGLYYVANSPGDPNWCGADHSLHKISRAGKISKAKNNICFWPIFLTVNDRFKRAEAKRWNEENATIEVKTIPNMAEVVAHFIAEAEQFEARAYDQAFRLRWGDDNETVKKNRRIAAHYRAVAAAIEG